MFKIKKRVIFADTDAGGVVYHSKYLDFCEEARLEFLIQNGFTQKTLMEENIIFVATGCEVKYIKPAKVEDLLEIRIDKVIVNKLKIEFYENIYRENELITECKIDIVAVNKDFKLVRKLPDDLLKVFNKNLDF